MKPCLECKRHNHSCCEYGMVHGTTFCNCGCDVLTVSAKRPEAKSSVQKMKPS